jgi:hypothetical protein
MDKEIIFIVEEDAEGGFTAKALGHPIFTEAESLEELKNDGAGCCSLPFR